MMPLFKLVIPLVLIWAGSCWAKEVELPHALGPYQIGTKAIELHDQKRKMPRAEEERRWMVQAFYPRLKDGETRFPYMPGTLSQSKVGRVEVFAHAKPEAEVCTDKTFPVVLFLPGLGQVRQSYTILCEALASYGYIVLSLDQPYNSSFVRFLDGKVVQPTLYDSWKVARDRDYRYGYFDIMMAAAIGDCQFMLDHLAELNQLHFKGQLDQQKIILMGHSFGGNVAHTLGFKDARVSAVVDIDSKITERKIYGRLGVPPNPHATPVLFIRAMMQYQEDVGDQLEKIQNATILKYHLEHSAFRDDAFFVTQIQSIRSAGMVAKLWDWLWQKGPQFDGIDTHLGGRDVNGWFDSWSKEIAHWLDSIELSMQLEFRQ